MPKSADRTIKRLEKLAKQRHAAQKCRCRLETLHIYPSGIYSSPGYHYTGEIYRPGGICPRCGKPYPDGVKSLVFDYRELVAAGVKLPPYLLDEIREYKPEEYKEILEREKHRTHPKNA